MFFQWSKLIDKFGVQTALMNDGLKLVVNRCGTGYVSGVLNSTGGNTGLVPV
jgi:hypothetical protein